jgi:hypothetical protein
LFVNVDYSLVKRHLLVATGTSARCRPDAMNEKIQKSLDPGVTHLHGMFAIYGATFVYKETCVQMLRICANYFVGMIKSSVYGH